MKPLKIFLSETTTPRVLIFGMYDKLMDLYQFVQVMPLWSKMGLPQGSHVLHRLIWEKHRKIFLSETTRLRALIFGM